MFRPAGITALVLQAKRPAGVGAPRSLQNLTHYHNLLAVRCSPQPKDAQTLEPMPNFKEPDLERRRAMALLLLHHVKNVRIAAFSSRESHSVVMECLSIPVGRAPHERYAPGRENKEGKGSQQGSGLCNLIIVLLSPSPVVRKGTLRAVRSPVN